MSFGNEIKQKKKTTENENISLKNKISENYDTC